MPDSNNQIVKIQPASPVNTVNRFTTLGTIPKTNYSSVLASTYDPYTLVHSPQPIQTGFPRNPNASQYVKKRYVQNLFSVEPNRVVVFSVSLFVSTRNFGTQLLCPLLTVVGATLVVK